MRVIAGRFGGLRLRSPKGVEVRPSSGRLREALFSILDPRLRGASFLDLFAGIGSAGIEALSRGASRIVFVEKDARTARALAENLAACGAGAECRILRRDAFAALRELDRSGERFSIVFADPPYGGRSLPRLLRAIAGGGLLEEAGLLVVEHRAGDLPPTPEGLVPLREERYGSSALAFYEMRRGRNG